MAADYRPPLNSAYYIVSDNVVLYQNKKDCKGNFFLFFFGLSSGSLLSVTIVAQLPQDIVKKTYVLGRLLLSEASLRKRRIFTASPQVRWIRSGYQNWGGTKSFGPPGRP